MACRLWAGPPTHLFFLGGAAAADVGASAGAVPDGGDPVPAPLAGNIFKIVVKPGQQVEEGDTLMILEAMKMETNVSASRGNPFL